VPPAAGLPPRRGLYALAGVCLAYLVLAVAFNLLTPAWDNNDENDHVKYIEHVTSTGAPPRIAYANGIESHQPPFYYYVVAAWQELLRIDSFTPNSPGGSYGPYTVSTNYDAEQERQAGWVHEFRLPSTAFGLLTVLAAFATGWLLSGDVMFATALSAAVAFWPKFLVITSAITNSSLVVALCSAAVPAFIMWQRTGAKRWAAATGAILGAAALTQTTALPLAGLVLLLALLLGWRRGAWLPLLVALAAFVAISGWWYVRNDVLYGSPLAEGATRAYLSNVPGLVRSPPSLSLHVLSDGVQTVSHSFWYDGGWNQLHLRSALDYAVWALAGIALVAYIASRRHRSPVLWAAIAGAVVAWLVIVRGTTQAEGRYLLIAIIPLAVLLVGGSQHMAGGRRAALWLWPAVFLGLDGYVLATWLIPWAHR
jgi:hypothetical protein